jgi:hypothetical protein
MAGKRHGDQGRKSEQEPDLTRAPARSGDLGSDTRKDPEDWITGDERMTGAQASYLKTLSEEANEPFDDSLTKAQASERIEELQRKTGRGTPSSS